jgi:hypothetical protein
MKTSGVAPDAARRDGTSRHAALRDAAGALAQRMVKHLAHPSQASVVSRWPSQSL